MLRHQAYIHVLRTQRFPVFPETGETTNIILTYMYQIYTFGSYCRASSVRAQYLTEPKITLAALTMIHTVSRSEPETITSQETRKKSILFCLSLISKCPVLRF